jgi:uncharacterized YkwD family protein
MKRIVLLVISALWVLFLMSACGTNERQRDSQMRNQSRMQTQSRMQISAVDTNLPVNKHVVQGQESLGDIAERYHVDIDDLLRVNPGLAGQIGVDPNKGTPNAGNPNTGNPNAGNPNVANPIAGNPNEGTPDAGNQNAGDVVNKPIDNGQTVTIPPNESLTGYEQQVLTLTNQERQKEGLSPCAGSDTNLNRSARAKSEDMAANNYFSHDSPTYGDPFAMMRNFGVQYQSAGENIAMGQPTPQEVVTAWMNSPGHRKNIMNGAYTHLGVGYVLKNGKAYWTQQFISRS